MPRATPSGNGVASTTASVTVNVSDASTSVSSFVDTDSVSEVSPAMIVNMPSLTAVKSSPEVAVSPDSTDVDQASTVSEPAAPDRLTVNSTSSSPSSDEAGAIDTVAIPPSVISTVAAVVLNVASPSVDAPVSVTTIVSPGSSTVSSSVAIVIVPLPSSASIVSVPAAGPV